MDKKAMFKLSYGLYVLTANQDGFDNGCIINTASQITSSPNRISIAVNKTNKTHDMIMKTGHFNISVLSEKADFSIFERFGFHSGKDTNKFSDFENFAVSSNGIKYITGYANSYISARLFHCIDLVTHTLMLADVTDCDVLSDDNSLTYNFYHQNIKPKNSPDAKKGKIAYRCKICGYIHYADELPPDFICPVCKHGIDDFEKIIQNN